MALKCPDITLELLRWEKSFIQCCAKKDWLVGFNGGDAKSIAGFPGELAFPREAVGLHVHFGEPGFETAALVPRAAVFKGYISRRRALHHGDDVEIPSGPTLGF